MSIRINVNALIVHDDKILLIQFEDENGPHYNLPGGGVEVGESLLGALQRECLEEANADVSVVDLVGSWEYVPELHGNKFGSKQKVGFIFLCSLKPGSIPTVPANPDPNQVAVTWMKISDLENLPRSRRHPIFPQIEEHLLAAIRRKYRAFFVSEI